MAKLCMIARENKRQKLVVKANPKRKLLKQTIKNLNVSYEEKVAAVKKLSECARDESAVRLRTRCQVCGRPRAVYRKFGLCRIHLREAVMRGDVPGVVKASW